MLSESSTAEETPAAEEPRQPRKPLPHTAGTRPAPPARRCRRACRGTEAPAAEHSSRRGRRSRQEGARPAAGSTVAEVVDAPAAGEEGPFGPGSAKPLADGAAPGAEFTVKGKQSSKLFHTAESPYFGRTKADVWFKTPADAENAGFAAWNHKKKATAK